MLISKKSPRKSRRRDGIAVMFVSTFDDRSLRERCCIISNDNSMASMDRHGVWVKTIIDKWHECCSNNALTKVRRRHWPTTIVSSQRYVELQGKCSITRRHQFDNIWYSLGWNAIRQWSWTYCPAYRSNQLGFIIYVEFTRFMEGEAECRLKLQEPAWEVTASLCTSTDMKCACARQCKTL